jgi:hypothetical protein
VITRRRVVIVVFVLLIALFVVMMVLGGRGGIDIDFDNFDFDMLRSQLFGSGETVVPDESSPDDCLDRQANRLSFDGDCELNITGSEEIPQPDNPRTLRLNRCTGASDIELTNDPKGLEVNTELPTQKDEQSLDFNIFHEGDTTVRLSCTTDDTCTIALNDAPCPTQQP